MTDDTFKTPPVTRRSIKFAERTQSKICCEEASEANPYLATSATWHGYDTLELARERSASDVLFLLLKGELPTQNQSALLERLLVLLANPGPRHNATRAVMSTSVSKTRSEHWLPIGMSMAGGQHLGASEVHDAIRFIRKHWRKDPKVCADLLRKETSVDDKIAPGFGKLYGGIDPYAQSVADCLLEVCPDSDAFKWANAFSQSCHATGMGWLMTGVAAACAVDLGLTPNAGAGLYQLAIGPGLLAHGLEMSGKPLTAMPFVDDEDYHYEEESV